jgi:hypothetical protein
MASGTVTVRLPEEVIGQLQKRADAENKKMSDLVRELIIGGLAPQVVESPTQDMTQVLNYLEGFGGVLMSILFETVGARYFAEMSTNYAMDMESLLREKQPMEKEGDCKIICVNGQGRTTH